MMFENQQQAREIKQLKEALQMKFQEMLPIKQAHEEKLLKETEQKAHEEKLLKEALQKAN